MPLFGEYNFEPLPFIVCHVQRVIDECHPIANQA
jgi:hypothetical protein